jgi:hypothetical protein
MRTAVLRLTLLLAGVSGAAASQTIAPDLNPATAQAAPDGPGLQNRKPVTPAEQAEAERISKLAIVNGRPYDQLSERDNFLYYVNDTYGLPGVARTTIRALYAQIQGAPHGWGTDLPGFGQRFGSSFAATAISGTTRYGFSELFHEDLRYIPCHGCSAKKKIENVLLSEIAARHDETGRRFFTLTPTIGDFSGPIIVHTLWYPGASYGPEAGVISARTYFATRIGQHLFTEFVWERLHHDPKIDQ